MPQTKTGSGKGKIAKAKTTKAATAKSAEPKRSPPKDFVVPVSGFIDAVLDSAYRRNVDEIKRLYQGVNITVSEQIGIETLVLLGKLPRAPKTIAFRTSLAATPCDDYGCTRA
ncbi:hypothetical protein [Mesorhizobium sp. B2-8-5]|uniref:hypothetical protein n=1 Tax=Mesorhizobium sp. B2-8-5 TaxID=2589903 RepID=UPI00112B1282|nr:hypothetical protein [Mesorhizobium sp. B2-8-5]UCI25809.1 hypothetical protein FJ430_30375 [Mesorhizobium sp. B2-8-5]